VSDANIRSGRGKLGTRPLIIVENREQFRWPGVEADIMTAAEFVADASGARRMVINLCRDYRYLGLGYYCSLLAEARGQTVYPKVQAILRLRSKPRRRSRKRSLAEDDRPLHAALARLPVPLTEPPARPSEVPRRETKLRLAVYLGHTANKLFRGLARRLFRLIGCPLMAVSLVRDSGSWRLDQVTPLGLDNIPRADDTLFLKALADCAEPAVPARIVRVRPAFRLGVLHDQHEKLSPSRRVTIDHMAEIGHELGIELSVLSIRERDLLPGFDGLFIRQTTSVENATFGFATEAERLGIPVIDDPASILRCGNKVYLAGLLPQQGVATPETRLVTATDVEAMVQHARFPLVLKAPDGCFGTGVKRAEDGEQFRAIAGQMLQNSAVILAQRFLPTAFDWRIGLLDGQPLFAARYHMCGDHWQIIRHNDDGSHAEGRTEAVPIAQVPAAVLDAAARAGALIGRGLYGIDLKETASAVYVIEINDNPNIDLGLEDTAEGDALYRRLLRHFQRAGRLSASRAA
jgi:glutathione synthase/RimK-type ligase-like ATP-grasp enzyme